MNDDQRLEFEYRPRLSGIVVLGGISLVGTVAMAWLAANNDRGLIINGALELDPSSAAKLYGGLAVFFALLMLLGLLMVYHRFMLKQRVVVDDAGLSVPMSRYSDKAKRLPFAGMEAISLQVAQRRRALEITHAGGKDTLQSLYFPTEEDFDAFRGRLGAGFDAATQARAHKPNSGA